MPPRRAPLSGQGRGNPLELLETARREILGLKHKAYMNLLWALRLDHQKIDWGVEQALNKIKLALGVEEADQERILEDLEAEFRETESERGEGQSENDEAITIYDAGLVGKALNVRWPKDGSFRTAFVIDFDMSNIREVVNNCERITKFFYGHDILRSLFLRHSKGKEISRPGATRFTTHFLSLRSLLDTRVPLGFTFISEEWTRNDNFLRLRISIEGVDVASLVKEIHYPFWSTVEEVVKKTHFLYYCKEQLYEWLDLNKLPPSDIRGDQQTTNQRSGDPSRGFSYKEEGSGDITLEFQGYDTDELAKKVMETLKRPTLSSLHEAERHLKKQKQYLESSYRTLKESLARAGVEVGDENIGEPSSMNEDDRAEMNENGKVVERGQNEKAGDNENVSMKSGDTTADTAASDSSSRSTHSDSSDSHPDHDPDSDSSSHHDPDSDTKSDSDSD